MPSRQIWGKASLDEIISQRLTLVENDCAVEGGSRLDPWAEINRWQRDAKANVQSRPPERSVVQPLGQLAVGFLCLADDLLRFFPGQALLSFELKLLELSVLLFRIQRFITLS